ncbi:MAG: polyisoprenoid-binding protein [Ignavibacteriales bacterium]|nr:polyisoprenoid-binding protein [Ignavibacteriales bacterium]
MKTLTIIFSLFLFSFTSFSTNPTTWDFDKAHSSIIFSVHHMVISEVSGSFKNFDGSVIVKNDDFSDSEIELTIDATSIDTDNEGRDKHLRADDFFNTEKFPQIKFKSKSFTKVGENKFKLVGDLTIRDITKEVEWDATFGGTAVAWGAKHAGFKVVGAINRFDYGLKWNKTIETGGLVAGDIVTIIANVELAQHKEKTEEAEKKK